jgi:hypothetical protein
LSLGEYGSEENNSAIIIAGDPFMAFKGETLLD